MTVDRKTPTLGARESTVTMPQYAEEVNNEVSGLWNAVHLVVDSASGTDTITGTVTPTLTAYAKGQMYTFTAAATNAGAATLDIDSVGAVAIVDRNGDALTGGEIVSGRKYLVIHDGTQFFLALAATDGAPGAAATITVGTVSAGTPGAGTVTFTNSGTSSAAVFDVTISPGGDGENGTDGTAGSDGADGIGGAWEEELTMSGALDASTDSGLQWSEKKLIGDYIITGWRWESVDSVSGQVDLYVSSALGAPITLSSGTADGLDELAIEITGTPDSPITLTAQTLDDTTPGASGGTIYVRLKSALSSELSKIAENVAIHESPEAFIGVSQGGYPLFGYEVGSNVSSGTKPLGLTGGLALSIVGAGYSPDVFVPFTDETIIDALRVMPKVFGSHSIGQSNENTNIPTTIIEGSDASAFNNKMLNIGYDTPNATTSTSIVDLTDASSQIIPISCAKHLSQRLFFEGYDPTEYFGLYATAAKGGKTLSYFTGSEIGADDWKLIINDAHDLATTASYDYKVVFVPVIIGENDSEAGTTKASFKSSFETMMSEQSAYLSSNNGQTDPVHYLVHCTAHDAIPSNGSAVDGDGPNMAINELRKENENVHVAGSLYYQDFVDPYHLSSEGVLAVGYERARAMHDIMVRKVRARALYCQAAYTEESDLDKIYVTFIVPRPPLRWEFDMIHAVAQDYGFRVTDDTGDLTIEDIYIDPRSTNTVIIEVNRDLDTNAVVRCALDYQRNARDEQDIQFEGASNLTDSTEDWVKINGTWRKFPYWVVPFQQEIIDVPYADRRRLLGHV